MFQLNRLYNSNFWLYSHNFTHSGAPLVLADIARALADSGCRKNLRVLSWGGLHDQRHSTLHHQLSEQGIHCQVLSSLDSAPQIKRGDRLLLNTLALPDHVIHQALDWLRQGMLHRLDWYAHESDPQIWIQRKDTRFLIVDALRSGGLQMRVPSIRVLREYEAWLGFSGHTLDVQCPVLDASSMFEGRDHAAKGHFATLRLALVGAVGSGNKGHLWLLHLLSQVFSVLPNNADGYRPVQLTFLGLETGPYAALTREVIRCATDLLGDQFDWFEGCSRHELVMQLKCSNVLVNCSLKESFSCVSAEALVLGMPLLRMQNGGFEEQLLVDKTGFDLGIPSPEVTQAQVQLLNHLRDPSNVPEENLLDMVVNARKHSQKFLTANYLDWLF